MRDEPIDLSSPAYTPRKLLEEVMWVLHAPRCAQLAPALDLDTGLISRIWNRKAPLTYGVFVQIMDRTGWGIAYVRQLAGMPYTGDTYPPRPRVIVPPKGRIYHSAREDILQAMPGTATELAKRAGYHREYIYYWLRKLRAGDPLTRASHIIGWKDPTGPNGSGDYAPIHAAGPGEDAARIRQKRCRVGLSQMRNTQEPRQSGA
jgi:hypothetical protein